MKAPRGYTVLQLHSLMPDAVPAEYDTSAHLIYNSPAALAFNSPGAEGFGVKRAGLAIPGSVMLIVSPGCCGRNTSDITRIQGYEERFFYLKISETDLVTARHLKMIPQAVEEVIKACSRKPSLVMICITCVDALLGTDMERVARKAEERAGIPVRPCYMYALTREGRRPPMVAVRQSLYSLLPQMKRRPSSVNLLGFFAPVDPESELFSLLFGIGVRKIRQISTCRDIDEFYRMGEANFNLVLNPEARDAANDLQERLGIACIELKRFYGTDRIGRQYQAFAHALGVRWEDIRGVSGAGTGAGPLEEARAEADLAFRHLKNEYPGLSFSVGEVVNADPFELALTLAGRGFSVKEIFANPSPEHAYYIEKLAELSPGTMVYSNMEPTMIYYDIDGGKNETCGGSGASDGMAEAEIHVTLGKDAAYYQPDAVHVMWNSDEQPWGYVGVRKLAEAILKACGSYTAQRTAADKISTAADGREDR